MAKSFNTAGPCQPDIHYALPPLTRVNLPELGSLIAARKYFVLHAPRQTGKTTCLLALERHLNARGAFQALYVSVEPAQGAREAEPRALRTILAAVAERAAFTLEDTLPRAHLEETLETSGADVALQSLLSRWARHSPQPLALLLDEVTPWWGMR